MKNFKDFLRQKIFLFRECCNYGNLGRYIFLSEMTTEHRNDLLSSYFGDYVIYLSTPITYPHLLYVCINIFNHFIFTPIDF